MSDATTKSLCVRPWANHQQREFSGERGQADKSGEQNHVREADGSCASSIATYY